MRDTWKAEETRKECLVVKIPRRRKHLISGRTQDKKTKWGFDYIRKKKFVDEREKPLISKNSRTKKFIT